MDNDIAVDISTFADPVGSSASSWILANNTIVDSTQSCIRLQATGSVVTADVRNNIIVGSGSYGIEDPDVGAAPHLDYNDLWQNALADWLVGADAGANNRFGRIRVPARQRNRAAAGRLFAPRAPAPRQVHRVSLREYQPVHAGRA